MALFNEQDGKGDFSVTSFSQMFQNCPLIRDLQLGLLNDEILKCIGRYLPQLEVLRFDEEIATTEGWQALATGNITSFHMYPLPNCSRRYPKHHPNPHVRYGHRMSVAAAGSSLF